MTNLTRRQTLKAVFGVAATAALAKATALKLGAPLLTDIEFKRCLHGRYLDSFDTGAVFVIIGRYTGPGKHHGERAYYEMFATDELLADPKGEAIMFEMCYSGLIAFVTEDVQV